MSDFNAIETYNKLREQYHHLLLDKTVGPYPNCGSGEKDRWERIREQLRTMWESEDTKTSLFGKPVLEGLYRYPSCTSSIQDLIDNKTLHPLMKELVKEELVNNSQKLYVHQWDAIQMSKDYNIIVSSGTGSGKTECFLYSMLNNMLNKEEENGKLEESLKEPGIRMLMIYPMNALVKDQVKRIVMQLKMKQPAIRVAQYTSQTPFGRPGSKHLQDWEINLRDEMKNRGRSWLDYYACCRPDIRRYVPHILITNYSMMEYMMLRDKDMGLFKGGKLQAIVLDEAHLYSGSLGNDINMLLRRVLMRFGKTKEEIRFYATSATIGNNKDDELKNAAASLFGVPPDTVCPIKGERQYYMSRTKWAASREMY